MILLSLGFFVIGVIAAAGSSPKSILYRSRASSDALPAFSGAEGFGSKTIGGRGGAVMIVTNTNDSGSGSLRSAIEANGPRIIVFGTGGLITLKSPLVIRNPFVTIAGQTAPGDGIAVRGAPISVETHDVVVRGMRVRIGDEFYGEEPVGSLPSSYFDRDGLKASGSDSRKVYNVVFDHNSISWAIDENMSTYDGGSSGNNVHDMTFSWNILTEGLFCSRHSKEPRECGNSQFIHSMGMLIGNDTKNVSVHHNLFASNADRNPLITSGTTTEFINNVVYNWELIPTVISGNGGTKPLFANIIGNYYKPTAGSRITNKGIYVKKSTPGGSRVYALSNIGPGRSTNTGDEWSAVAFESDTSESAIKSDTPALGGSGVTTVTPDNAYQLVLEGAGATVPYRDTVDTRAVVTTKDGTGPVGSGKWMVDSQGEVGGWPVYKTGTSETDNDQDGMPDAWESQKGGDKNPASYAPSGYTWIEEYINGKFQRSLLIPTMGVPSKSEGASTVSYAPVAPQKSSDTALGYIPSLTPTVKVTTAQSATNVSAITVFPIADTFVRKSSPTKNYGSSRKLEADGSPEKIIYLMFDLGPYAGKSLKRAELTLRVTDSSKDTYNIKAIGDTAWTEKSLVFTGKPPASASLGTLSRPKSGKTMAVDMTNYLKDKLGTRVAISISSSGTDGVDFYSKENSKHKPSLLITLQ